MTTKELKSKLKGDIENLDNPEILEMMNMLLDTYKEKKLTISERHISFLEESNNGKVYTNEEAKKLVDKWLEN
jgi:hypothetical protein